MIRALSFALAITSGGGMIRAEALAETRSTGVPTGLIEISNFPAARLDGRDVVLAPGVRIHGADNRIVLPQQLRGPRKIAYRLDFLGQVIEIRLLEARKDDVPVEDPLSK